MTLFGTSVDTVGGNLAQLEKTIGCQSPVARQYRAIDRQTSYANLAGRQVLGSAKPKIGNNLVPIADLLANKYEAFFSQNTSDLVALPTPEYGKNKVINWHEFDVGTLNGTPAQITQFVLAMNALSRQIDTGKKLDVAVCIGSWNMGLYQTFKQVILDADIVLIDQPYTTTPTTQTAASILSPRIAALKALGVKRLGIAEYGCTNVPGRAQWLRDSTAYIIAQGIEVATWFDSGGDTIIGTSDEWALDMAIYEGRMLAAEAAAGDQQLIQQLQTKIANGIQALS